MRPLCAESGTARAAYTLVMGRARRWAVTVIVFGLLACTACGSGDNGDQGGGGGGTTTEKTTTEENGGYDY
jgi:hypothetical protein